MAQVTEPDGTVLYFPRPNKRVIRRLELAVKRFRLHELEDLVSSSALTMAVVDAAEVMLRELEPQPRRPSEDS